LKCGELLRNVIEVRGKEQVTLFPQKKTFQTSSMKSTSSATFKVSVSNHRAVNPANGWSKDPFTPTRSWVHNYATQQKITVDMGSSSSSSSTEEKITVKVSSSSSSSTSSSSSSSSSSAEDNAGELRVIAPWQCSSPLLQTILIVLVERLYGVLFSLGHQAFALSLLAFLMWISPYITSLPLYDYYIYPLLFQAKAIWQEIVYTIPDRFADLYNLNCSHQENNEPFERIPDFINEIASFLGGDSLDIYRIRYRNWVIRLIFASIVCSTFFLLSTYFRFFQIYPHSNSTGCG